MVLPWHLWAGVNSYGEQTLGNLLLDLCFSAPWVVFPLQQPTAALTHPSPRPKACFEGPALLRDDPALGRWEQKTWIFPGFSLAGLLFFSWLIFITSSPRTICSFYLFVYYTEGILALAEDAAFMALITQSSRLSQP